MLSWGTKTASPGGLYGYWPAAYLAVALGYNSAQYQLCRACLRLDRRAISVQYRLHPKDQAAIQKLAWPVWQLFLLARALRLALCPLHLTPRLPYLEEIEQAFPIQQP